MALPDVVVFPESTHDVVVVVRAAYKYGVPVVARGGGTSMTAGSIARGGILLDMKRMSRVLWVDEDSMVARVEAGIPILRLNEELARRGLWFPYSPESKAVATVGAAIALRSDNALGIRYGKIENLVSSVLVVTGRGEAVEFGHRKTCISASGYHLHWLMVSSEGTLGVITEATIRLVPLPRYRRVLGMVFPRLLSGLRTVNDVLASGLGPESANLQCRRRLSFYTHAYRVKYGREPSIPEWANAVLFISYAGDEDVVEFSASKTLSIAAGHGGEPIRDEEIVRSWWTSKHVTVEPPELRMPWEEPFPPFKQKWPDSQRVRRFGAAGVSVPPGALEEAYRYYIETAKRYGLEPLGMNVYFQQPNGNHVSVSFAVWVGDSEDEVRRFYMYVRDMAVKAVDLGGSMSGYYGDGEVLAGVNEYEHGASLRYMLNVKKVFDPGNIMNPGKKFGRSMWIP